MIPTFLLGFVCGVFVSVFEAYLEKAASNQKAVSLAVRTITKATDQKYEVLLEDGRVFRGAEGSVWREYPSGNRAHTGLEAWLSDRLTAFRWEDQR